MVKKIPALVIVVYLLLLTVVGCGGKQPSTFVAENMETECLNKPLTHNRYFAGYLLTAEDLENEQSYFVEKNRQHNRFLHGVGVVCGLEVKADPERSGSVVVSPGLAIDGTGREVLVPESQIISLDGYSGDVYLTVCYKESLIGPSPVLGQAQGMEYRRVRESFKFEALMALPEGYVSTYDLLRNSDDDDKLQRIFQNHLNCCNNAEDTPIVLAKIDIGRSGRFEDKDIDNIRFRKLILNSSDIALSLADD